MYAAKDSKHGVYGELFKYDYVAKVVACFLIPQCFLN